MPEFIENVDIKSTTGPTLRIRISADGYIILNYPDGRLKMRIGTYYDPVDGTNFDTFLIVNPAGEKIVNLSSAGSLELGGAGTNGEISLRYKDSVDSIFMGKGNMMLFDEEGHRGFALLSKAPSLSGLKPTTGMWIGGSPSEGPKAGIVFIRDTDGNDSIKLDGASGDIILSNADCAEDFDVAQPYAIEPGSVVVIDTDGKLRESDRAYDKRVAGVVSGAKGYRPGIILDKSNSSTTRRSVSLMGKVYCKADPAYAPIEVGDLLTTSKTLGHAMKATDPTKAFGSVIGKALSSIERRAGLIPILVTFQ
jgi:hypothetical protein